MLTGHYSAAFLAKRMSPSLSFPLLLIACQLVDIFWAILVLSGVEKLRVIPDFNPSNPLDLYFMPYTHSLPAALVWSGLAAILYWLFSKGSARRLRNAILIGGVAGSHWILDYIVHLPDLPLWHDSLKVGLGLWNFRYIALVLELALLWSMAIACLKIAKENRWRFILLTIVMSALQIWLLLMPPPSSDQSVAWQLLAVFLGLTILGYWAGKPRRQAGTKKVAYAR